MIGYYIAAKEVRAINDSNELRNKRAGASTLKMFREPLMAARNANLYALSLLRADYLAAAFCVLLIAALMISFNGGISVGMSNHFGLLPVARRILDPDYLPGDFGISVRFYHHRVFAYVVAGFTAVLGEDLGLIVLTLVGMTLLSFSLFSLCQAIGLGVPGSLAVGLIAATKLGWTGLGLEINNFVGNPDIMPTTFAHGFVLLSTLCLFTGRLRLAALLAGIVLLLHLQIGLIFALVISPLFIAKVRSSKITDLLTLAVLFLLPGSLSLFHFYQMMAQGLASSSFSLDYINFRHPHHFELQSVGAAIWVAAHLAVQTISYLWLRSTGRSEQHGVAILFAMSVSISLLCVFHFVDYYYLGLGSISKVQFLRMSPFITVFGAISLVVALYARWDRRRSVEAKSRHLVTAGLILLTALWSVYVLVSRPREYYFGVKKYSQQTSDWADICLWIRDHGPRGSVYLTPPDRGGFTSMTDRSNVVEFKINPDGGLFLVQWYERLRDLVGGTLPNARGFQNYPLLKEGYASLDQTELLRLAEKYRAEYAVLTRKSLADFEVLYENDQYLLVRLESLESQAARGRQLQHW